MLRPRTREAVDRLVVVPDRAEVVARAQPELEQPLLEPVDVLVLVYRERSVPLAECRGRRLVVLVQGDRLREQILEVDQPGIGLAPLVLAVDPET